MATYSRSVDSVFAGAQALVSVVGCTLNSISFRYFSTLKSNNRNSRYFKRLYTVITLNDFLICAATIPVIEAAFAPDREGLIFSNDVFCGTWAVGYILGVAPMSVFLIGMLSLSRLMVLKYPNIALRPALSFIIPTTCFCCLLASSIGLLLSSIMYTGYIPGWLTCYPFGYSIANTSHVVTHQDEKNDAFINAFILLIPGLAVTPISVAFILSLVYLKKSIKVAANVNSSTKRHQEATKTVVIVTLAYIVFTIPYAIYATVWAVYTIYLTHHASGVEESTVQDLQDELGLAGEYTDAIAAVFLVSLNSAINPVIYFWRMSHYKKHFRGWFCRVWGAAQERFTSRVSQNRAPAALQRHV